MQPREAIIGLAGPAGVGKSTLAKRIAADSDLALRGVRVRVMSFADPLRDMLRALGVPEGNLSGPLAAKEQACAELCGATARRAMQLLGTEWGRKLSPDLWIAAWRRRLHETEEQVVVIDDVRFGNEADAIHAAGGVVLALKRGEIGYSCAHASEVGLDAMHIDATLNLSVADKPALSTIDQPSLGDDSEHDERVEASWHLRELSHTGSLFVSDLVSRARAAAEARRRCRMRRAWRAFVDVGGEAAAVELRRRVGSDAWQRLLDVDPALRPFERPEDRRRVDGEGVAALDELRHHTGD